MTRISILAIGGLMLTASTSIVLKMALNSGRVLVASRWQLLVPRFLIVTTVQAAAFVAVAGLSFWYAGPQHPLLILVLTLPLTLPVMPFVVTTRGASRPSRGRASVGMNRFLLRMATWVYSPAIVEEVFVDALADIEEMHANAIRNRQLLKARWVIVRGYGNLVTVVLALIPGWVKAIFIGLFGLLSAWAVGD